MEIGNPQLSWLGLLLVIPIALYLIRKRVMAVEVSTLVFFKSLAREHRESSWLRSLKRWLSLFLSLAMLGGAVLALMELRPGHREGDLRGVVVMLDRSASIGALLPDGRTRLEAAKEALLGQLKRLNAAVPVAVIACDESPEVILPATNDPSGVPRVLGELKVRAVEGRLDRAADLALSLAKQETPSEIWFASDHVEAPGLGMEAEGVRWRKIPVPGAGMVNAGLTAFQLRPVPLQRGRLSCFLEVTANKAAGEGLAAQLEIRTGNVRQAPRSLTLRGGEGQLVEFPVEGLSGQELQLRLMVEGDCFPEDNEVLVRLPEIKPAVVVRVGPRDRIDPFLHVALQSLAGEHEMQVWSVEPEQWPVSGAEVVVFDGWLPAEWPRELPVIVVNPPESEGPVRVVPLRQGGIPQPRIRVLDRDHPVLFRVSGEQLSVLQTCVVEPPPGVEPLWKAERETLLSAGEWNGQRMVILGFSPRRSAQLPLMDAFPLMIGNALFWCAEQRGKDQPLARQSLRTGSLLPVTGKEVRWWRSEGDRTMAESRPISRGLLELDRSGIWETDTGETGPAHLLSLQETREAGDSPLAEGEKAAAADLPGGWLPRNLTWAFLGAILTLLLAESLLFHRFAVY